MRSFVLVLLSVAFSLPVLAGEGAREISQVCAVDTGCFPGDSAGFPVTITAAGSYVLTGDLQVPDENTSGIFVQTPNATVDLGGFEIRGVTTCSGTPLVCSPSSGNGTGLVIGEGGRVLNGTVIGMGLAGVFAGPRGVVENVHATQNRFWGIRSSTSSAVVRSIADLNGGDGIEAESGSTITGNNASGNVLAGISVGAGSTVAGNTVHSNGSDGIQTNQGCSVTGNTAYLNARNGIFAFDGSLVRGNTTYQNGQDGIFATQGVTIVNNTSYDNGDSTTPELDDGIDCFEGCDVRGNTVRDNSGYGLNVGASAYRENVVTNNATGGIFGFSSINRGNNYCAGTGVTLADCP